MNEPNKYSFCLVDKEKAFTIASNNEETQNTRLYSLNRGKVIEEYSFKSGNRTLYIDNNDGTLSMMFNSIAYPDINCCTYNVFQPDGAYFVTREGDSLSFVSFLSDEDYGILLNIHSLCDLIDVSFPKLLSSPLFNNLDEQYIARHSIPLIIDGVAVAEDEHLYKRFKQSFIRYSMVSEYIPASAILQNILNQITHYIATGELNEHTLLSAYNDLQSFDSICAQSLETVSQFINRTPSTDLRSIIQKLQKANENISNIINIYLSEELETEQISELER